MQPEPLTKGGRTRAKILDAAVRLLAKRGYEGTSFQMIADALGLTQSAVMHHFPSKRELIDAAVEAAVSRNRATVESLARFDDDAARRLLNFCRGNMLWAVRYREDAQVLALLYYLACHDKDFAKNLYQAVERGRLVIARHLLAGRREGVFEFSAPVEEAARLLQDCVIGAMLWATANPAAVTRYDLEERWAQALRLHAGWRAEAAGARGR